VVGASDGLCTGASGVSEEGKSGTSTDSVGPGVGGVDSPEGDTSGLFTGASVGLGKPVDGKEGKSGDSIELFPGASVGLGDGEEGKLGVSPGVGGVDPSCEGVTIGFLTGATVGLGGALVDGEEGKLGVSPGSIGPGVSPDIAGPGVGVDSPEGNIIGLFSGASVGLGGTPGDGEEGKSGMFAGDVGLITGA
jgi:hypothetical protein